VIGAFNTMSDIGPRQYRDLEVFHDAAVYSTTRHPSLSFIEAVLFISPRVHDTLSVTL
jgi:hypothetical protein